MPSCGSCTAKRQAQPFRQRGLELLRLVADDHDDRLGVERPAARRTWSMSGSPAARCRTLGNADFIRVPLPGGEDDDMDVG